MCLAAAGLVVEWQCSCPHEDNVETGREPTCQGKWEEVRSKRFEEKKLAKELIKYSKVIEVIYF